MTLADLLPLGVAILPNSFALLGGGVPDDVDSESADRVLAFVGVFFVGVFGASEFDDIVVASSLIRTRAVCVVAGFGFAVENPMTNQNPIKPV